MVSLEKVAEDLSDSLKAKISELFIRLQSGRLSDDEVRKVKFYLVRLRAQMANQALKAAEKMKNDETARL